ncbi:MAG: M15 family metallopeptidase [Oscillospiraceae bacterium]|nr:M15 family metallopeptidase [Oscillospiraceae bacterium]
MNHLNYQKHHNYQRKSIKRRRPLPIFLMLFIVSITASLVMGYIFSNEPKHEIPPRPHISSDSANGNFSETPKRLNYDQLVALDNSHLLLINSDCKVPDDLSGGFDKVLDYVKTLNAELVLNKDALVALKEMFDYAVSAGYDEFRVTEGYRTFEYQKSLYEAATDKSLVAFPGYSEHQTGLAVDISYNGVNIGNSQQGSWLMDNAYNFGFVLRYPAHKTDITKIPFEPWHYRYVGQPHAYYCHQNDLVLEEYIKYLQANKEITITFNGTEYKIYYLSDKSEEIEIPQNCLYLVSTDNTNGLIVTIWRTI